MGRFLCNIDEIDKHEGCYVASKVYDENGRLLLNLNYKISGKAKAALKKQDIHIIWLSESPTKEAPDIDDKRLVSLKAKRSVLQGTFADVKKEVMMSRKRNKMNISLSKKNIKKIEDSIDAILDQIIENPFVAATLEPLYNDADFLVKHSVNVTYFGLCMLANYPGVMDILKDEEKGMVRFEASRRINNKSFSLSTFGMTCFLHDIGKIHILDIIGSEESYDANNEETKEIWEQIKKHTIVGHDMLFGKQINAHALLGIKYHHENFDGSGYPFGVTGYKIHPFSRIIRVIDSFDAAIAKGPGRADKDFKTILGELLALSGKYYDPEIVKYFIDLLLGGKSGLVSKGIIV